MSAVYTSPTPGNLGGWANPWGATPSGPRRPAGAVRPGAKFHGGDGYEYLQLADGNVERVGVSSQSDLYSGDSYLRGMPSVSQDRAYELETQRAQGRQQLASQAANAMGQLGSSAMGAMGNYGSAVAGSLANQSIAAGNTFGQMANNYYNTLGQMSQMGGALSAAGLAASSNAANASMASNLGLNIGGGFGGGGGFGVSGPGGPVASGLMGGGQFVGGNLGGMGAQGMSVQRGGGAEERGRMLGQGFDFLGGAMGHLNNPNNQAMALAGLAQDQFTQNRKATMNPMFLNSMNNTFANSRSAMGAMSQGKELPPMAVGPGQSNHGWYQAAPTQPGPAGPTQQQAPRTRTSLDNFNVTHGNLRKAPSGFATRRQ